MNCREAQTQIFAERDGALDPSGRAALEGHLAQCEACRRVRETFTAALTTWRAEVSNVRVPDAEREWHSVRRRIRGGVESGAARVSRPRRNPLLWFALPVGAAAAVALTLFLSPPASNPASSVGSGHAQSARASSVDATGNNATMVFVDEKSGWLFVLANDDSSRRG